MCYLYSFPNTSKADYPEIFPSLIVLLGKEPRLSDSFTIGPAFSFSMWEKKINKSDLIEMTNIEPRELLTIQKSSNYVLGTIINNSGGKISVKNLDILLSGEYSFSKNFFINFGFFLRNRTLGEITSSFGLGDINLNLTGRILTTPIEIYLSGGGVIPLTGDPDEKLLFLERINTSSFAVDVPLYTLARKNFDIEAYSLSIFLSGGYIYRAPYNFFGITVSPGDLATLSAGTSITVKNFFPTSENLLHDIIFSFSPYLIHGFPELQDAGVYKISGRPWDIVKLKLSSTAVIRKRTEKLGEIVTKEWLFIDLSFHFPLLERNFLYFNRYGILRFPFLDRVNSGFSSTISLNFTL